MHPYLSSSIASEHRRDLRRAADTWRQRRPEPGSGRLQRRIARWHRVAIDRDASVRER